MTLSSQESIRHAAADEQAVDARHQVLQRVHLAADLGAAENGDEGRLGRAQEASEGLDFADDQPPRRLALEDRRYAGDGGVRAMNRAERIGNVGVGQRRQCGGEFRLIGGFGVVIAEVLEQTDLPGGERPARCARGLSDAVGRKTDLAAHQLAKGGSHGPKAELGLRLAFRAAAVRGQEQRSAGPGELRERRQRGLESRRVSDTAFGQRNVEIDAYEDARALEVAEIEIFQLE